MSEWIGAVTIETVKAWLQGYQELNFEHESQLERLAALEDQVCSVSSPVLSDMPRGSNTTSFDRFGKYIVKKEGIEKSLQIILAKLENREREIENTIQKLPRAEQRQVIRLRYLDLLKWQEVSFSLFGAEEDFADREESYLRRVTKIHGRALRELVDIIREQEKETGGAE